MSDPGLKVPAPSLRWADAIRTRVPENVVMLYHPEGLLWGTLSQVIRHGRNPIHDYFLTFLKWEDLQCEFKTSIVREFDEYLFHSGEYLFTWKDGTNTKSVPARFSFVFKKEGDQWLIFEHHSSLFPPIML